MKNHEHRLRTSLVLGVSAFAIGVAMLGIASDTPFKGLVGAAIASSHGGGEQTGEGNQGGGNQGGSDGGHDDGGHDDTTDTTHDDGEESDGRGPRAGQSSDSAGGKPVWAQEGLPEIELGRLNVARSPEHVLDRSYDEVLANFTPEMAEFYSMTLDEAITALTTNFDNLSFVDSPLQNLALFKDALDGTSVLDGLLGVTNTNDTLLAMFLGAASDKTVPITSETAYAVAMILGTELTEAEATALAADAEAIRIAILAGHG